VSDVRGPYDLGYAGGFGSGGTAAPTSPSAASTAPGMPRTGPCNPWINGDDVFANPRVQATWKRGATRLDIPEETARLICARVALAATITLYELSGRTRTGVCGPITVRPVARPADIDTRWHFQAGFGWGYIGNYGYGNRNFLGIPSVVSAFATHAPPEIEFNVYPVDSIVKVTIDGVTIPPNEYELRDHRTLVRLRPSQTYNPTERWGWPTTQIMDLPETEPGTFAVTLTYGVDPGEDGREACRALAEYLALPQFGDSSHYPQRVVSIARQGVDIQVASALDLLKNRQTGIYEVDLWLLAVNPGLLDRQSQVWSPDIVQNRRVPGVMR
jgi:hypothetical protein